MKDVEIDLEIKKVENGWLIITQGKENNKTWIANNVDEIGNIVTTIVRSSYGNEIIETK